MDAVASATLKVGKTGDGLDAIRWWREGKMLEIAEYCCFDVKCTKLVHEYGWGVKRRPDGEVWWVRPNGIRYRAGPEVAAG